MGANLVNQMAQSYPLITVCSHYRQELEHNDAFTSFYVLILQVSKYYEENSPSYIHTPQKHYGCFYQIWSDQLQFI